MPHTALRKLCVTQAPWDQMHMAMPDRLPSDFATIHADVVAADGWIQRIDYFFENESKHESQRLQPALNQNNQWCVVLE